MTESVGIRDLKGHLSAYVGRAHAGESITVTDHGRPVARLVPVHGESALERLIAEQLAARPVPRRPLPPPIEGVGAASDLVAEQRR